MAAFIGICSPLKPYTGTDGVAVSFEQNIADVKAYARAVSLMGYPNYAPHLYYPQFLDDFLESERQLGMKLGIETLQKVEELWVFGTFISGGMTHEIRWALGNGLVIRWFKDCIPRIKNAFDTSQDMGELAGIIQAAITPASI